MFAISDRPFGSSHGDTDPKQLPVPRNDVAGFGGDERGGSSTASEGVPEWDMDDVFDFPAYLSDHGTDATSLSDAASGGKSPAAPLVTTPSGDEDSRMPDAPSSHVWPIVPDTLLPRESDIQLGTSPSPPSPSPSTSTEMCAEEESQVASPSGQKRTRKVKSAEDTGQVRAMRACVFCKMKKTSVSALSMLSRP